MIKNYFFLVPILASVLLFGVSSQADQVPLDLIKSLLPANPIVLEAGARFGEDTQWMAKLWPTGHVHAFEPTPVSYALLQKNIAECQQTYQNITCYQLALAEKNGSALFYIDGGDGGGNGLLRPHEWFNADHFHGDLTKPISVECITLDAWAQTHNIERIDFMWLDLEGHELFVLKSGPEILKTVRVIFTEVNLQLFRENIPLYPEVKSWLENQGFREVWSEIIPDWRGNLLFVRS